MSSLFASLSITVHSLLAEQGALGVTANNVSNINTPGFSRQRPVLLEGTAVLFDPLVLGTGVVFGQPQSLRDSILELRLHEEAQQQGKSDASLQALNQLQVLFTENASDIGSQLSIFFNSLNNLSSDPSSLPLRQGALTSATNLASSFRSTSAQLQEQRANLDLNVVQQTEQINQLTRQIAVVNQQVSALENVGRDASAFVDQRTQLLRQLSGLVDVRVIDSGDNSIAVTTANGTALVAADRSFALSNRLGPTGVEHIFSQGTDITAQLVSGSLAGVLSVRDQTIPGLLANLDTLATGLSNALNTSHLAGFDLNGNPGTNLFTAPPLGGVGAAGAIQVAITDPSQIAASSDGSAGSNGNLASLIAVAKQQVAGGQTSTNFYSGIVFSVGSATANAAAEAQASGTILRQLEDQRGSISGVSLDEEASNLIRYQRAYEASAHVFATLSSLTETVINLGKG